MFSLFALITVCFNSVHTSYVLLSHHLFLNNFIESPNFFYLNQLIVINYLYTNILSKFLMNLGKLSEHKDKWIKLDNWIKNNKIL